MSQNFSVPIHTGDPNMDQQQAQQMVQQYAAQGMSARVEPNPSGGLIIHVSMAPMGGAPMGGPPPGGAPMGGPPPGGAPMGGPPPGGAPMGGFPPGGPVGQAPSGDGSSSGSKVKKIVSAVGGGVVVLGVAAGAGWMYMHPEVYVDNPSSKSVAVFVDGKKKKTLKAGSKTSFRVSTGSRKFGWGDASASTPSETVKRKIKGGKSYLYNPGRTGCYWLQHDSYGRSRKSTPAGTGPQPIQDVYEFKRVDNWFRDNPSSVKTKKKKNIVRVALRRAKACTSFMHCPVKVRENLMTCLASAYRSKSKSAIQSCGDAAARACKPQG